MIYLLLGRNRNVATHNAISRRRLVSRKEEQLEINDAVVAVFADHRAAEAAVKKLTAAGFEMKNLSVVGKGYHTEEKVVGFYNTGDRVKFWGKRGAFWGGLLGLVLRRAVHDHSGHRPCHCAWISGGHCVSAIESAVVVGGLSALGAALYSIGVPKDSVIQYEAAVKADSFLVMAHGSAEEMARAKAILGTANPSRLAMHTSVGTVEPGGSSRPRGGWLNAVGPAQGTV